MSYLTSTGQRNNCGFEGNHCSSTSEDQMQRPVVHFSFWGVNIKDLQSYWRWDLLIKEICMQKRRKNSKPITCWCGQTAHVKYEFKQTIVVSLKLKSETFKWRVFKESSNFEMPCSLSSALKGYQKQNPCINSGNKGAFPLPLFWTSFNTYQYPVPFLDV